MLPKIDLESMDSGYPCPRRYNFEENSQLCFMLDVPPPFLPPEDRFVPAMSGLLTLGQRREKAKKDRQVTRRVMENVERLEQEAEILERKTNEKRLEAETLAELENTGKR